MGIRAASNSGGTDSQGGAVAVALRIPCLPRTGP